MPRQAPIPTEVDIQQASKVYKQLLLEDGTGNTLNKPPSVFAVFKRIGFTKRSVQKLIDQTEGGHSVIEQRLMKPDDEIDLMYVAVCETITKRVVGNTIEDKSLLELFKLIKGIKDAPQTQIEINVGIDDYLKNVNIIDG